jgi:2,3-bisphosphoglycerate-independent phosphoglycerate mutase
VLEGIKKFGDYAILCTPDHPTSVQLMTHTSEPVPFVIYRGGEGHGNGALSYDEDQARATGLAVAGHVLMEMLLKK